MAFFFFLENPIFLLVDGGETCNFSFGFGGLFKSRCNALQMLNTFKCIGGKAELISVCFANISIF